MSTERVKSLLVVAGDRALTRFIAETLLTRKLDRGGPHLRGNGWAISRAHSGLEGLVLLTKSDQKFDAVLVDQNLPDRDALSFLERVRQEPAGDQIPLFVMTERGRDQLTRKLASDQYAVTGFIDKPVTAESLRRGLRNLERMRHVLIVDPDDVLRGELEAELRRASFSVETAASAQQALTSVAASRPDAVVIGLGVADMPGAQLCIQLKRSAATHTIPVILHGSVAELAAVDIPENAHRADDFIQAPVTGSALVNRILALVGRGASRVGPPPMPPASLSPPLLPPSATVADRPLGEPDGGPRKPFMPPTEEQAAYSASAAQQQTSPLPSPAAPPADEWGGKPSSTRRNLPAVPRTVESAVDFPIPSASDPGLESPPPSLPPASASPSQGGQAKRSTRRVPCNLSVSFRDGATIYQSTTLNISNGGILIATDHPLAMGTHIDLTLELPDRVAPITAVGKVAWTSSARTPTSSDSGSHGVGVKFSKIAPQDLKEIVDYVNSVSRAVYVAP